MVRKQRAAFFAVCFLLAACAAPNSAPVRTIAISPSAALDDDLKRLDELVQRHDFLAVPTSRDRTETATGPVDVLRAYELRERRALKVSIGWELRHSRYRVYVTDLPRGGAPLHGLDCRKYLELFADITKTFGADRVTPASAETCDPRAD